MCFGAPFAIPSSTRSKSRIRKNDAMPAATTLKPMPSGLALLTMPIPVPKNRITMCTR